MWEVTRPLMEPNPCRAVAKADGKEEEAVGIIMNENRPEKNIAERTCCGTRWPDRA